MRHGGGVAYINGGELRPFNSQYALLGADRSTGSRPEHGQPTGTRPPTRPAPTGACELSAPSERRPLGVSRRHQGHDAPARRRSSHWRTVHDARLRVRDACRGRRSRPMEAASRRGATRRRRPGEDAFRLGHQRPADLRPHPKTNSSAKGAVYCRVQGAMGTAKSVRESCSRPNWRCCSSVARQR